jgi:hypothetical protein
LTAGAPPCLFPLIRLPQNNFSDALFYNDCAGSSGAVHSVFLIDVYLDLENPGGSGFWVGENRRVTKGNKEGQFTSIREQRWTGPDTEGGLQVSRLGEQGEQGEQGKQGEQGADFVHKSEPYLVYV